MCVWISGWSRSRTKKKHLLPWHSVDFSANIFLLRKLNLKVDRNLRLYTFSLENHNVKLSVFRVDCCCRSYFTPKENFDIAVKYFLVMLFSPNWNPHLMLEGFSCVGYKSEYLEYFFFFLVISSWHHILLSVPNRFIIISIGYQEMEVYCEMRIEQEGQKITIKKHTEKDGKKRLISSDIISLHRFNFSFFGHRRRSNNCWDKSRALLPFLFLFLLNKISHCEHLILNTDICPEMDER